MILADFSYTVYALWVSGTHRYYNYLTLSVPDEGYTRNPSCALNLTSIRFYYYHWIDTSAGGLLFADGSWLSRTLDLNIFRSRLFHNCVLYHWHLLNIIHTDSSTDGSRGASASICRTHRAASWLPNACAIVIVQKILQYFLLSNAWDCLILQEIHDLPRFVCY